MQKNIQEIERMESISKRMKEYNENKHNIKTYAVDILWDGEVQETHYLKTFHNVTYGLIVNAFDLNEDDIEDYRVREIELKYFQFD